MFDKQNEFIISNARYEEGLSCEKTRPEEAIGLFKKSAASGHLMAACRLKSIYLEKKDEALAINYERMADEAYEALIDAVHQNNKDAKIVLSCCYREGIYLKKNLDLARMFCEEVLTQDPTYTPAIVELMKFWQSKDWKKGIEILDNHLSQQQMFDTYKQILEFFPTPHFVSLLFEVAQCYLTGKLVPMNKSKAIEYLIIALVKNAMLEKPVMDVHYLQTLADETFKQNDFELSIIFYHHLLMLKGEHQDAALGKISELLKTTMDAKELLCGLIRSAFLLGDCAVAIRYCDWLIPSLLKSGLTEYIGEIAFFSTQIFMSHALMGNQEKVNYLIPNLSKLNEEYIDRYIKIILEDVSAGNFPHSHNELYKLAQTLGKHKLQRVECTLLAHILNSKNGFLATYSPGNVLPFFMKVIDSYLKCTRNLHPQDKPLRAILISIKLREAKIADSKSQPELKRPIKSPAPVIPECKKPEVAKPINAKVKSIPKKNPKKKKNNPSFWLRRFERTTTPEVFEENIQQFASKNSKTPPQNITIAILGCMERLVEHKERLEQVIQDSGLVIKLLAKQEKEITPIKIENSKSEKPEEIIPPKIESAEPEKVEEIAPMEPEPNKAEEMAIIPYVLKPTTRVQKQSFEDRQNERAILPPPVRRKRSNTMWVVPDSANKKISPTLNREKYLTEATLFADKKREAAKNPKYSAGPLYQLADAYYYGTGVKRNTKMVVSLYEEIINLCELPSAYYNLGLSYKHGSGVKQNFITAFKFFHVAALRGFPLAQTELAFLYFNGTEGTKINLDEGIAWMRTAASAGEERAMQWMQDFYLSYSYLAKSLKYHPVYEQNENNIPKTEAILEKPRVIEAPKPSIEFTLANEFENLDKKVFDPIGFENVLRKLKPFETNNYKQFVAGFYITLFNSITRSTHRKKMTENFIKSLKTVMFPEKEDSVKHIIEAMDALRQKSNIERFIKTLNSNKKEFDFTCFETLLKSLKTYKNDDYNASVVNCFIGFYNEKEDEISKNTFTREVIRRFLSIMWEKSAPILMEIKNQKPQTVSEINSALSSFENHPQEVVASDPKPIPVKKKASPKTSQPSTSTSGFFSNQNRRKPMKNERAMVPGHAPANS